MNKLKKIIVEIDGKETEYDSLSECAKALGVSVAAVSQCASYGWLCKGHVVRYADGTMRIRKTRKPRAKATPKAKAKPQIVAKQQSTAEDVNKMIAEWHTKKWRGICHISSADQHDHLHQRTLELMPDTNETYMKYAQYIDAVFRIELNKRRDAGFFVSREDEEDLHQAILLKVLKYLPRHDPHKSSIKTYIYTIVKTHLKWEMIWMYGMKGRRSKESWNRSFEMLDDRWDAPAGRTIDDVIEGMEEPMRKAVLLLLDGASHNQVRQQLGMTGEEWEAMLEEIRDYLTECP